MADAYTRNDALAGVQQLVQTPLARGAVRYWWVTMPLAVLGWHYWKQRSKEGKANVGQLVQDMVPAVGLIGTLITLNAVLDKQEKAKVALPSGPIREAEFTSVVPAEIVS